MNRRDFIKYSTVLAGVGGVCSLCGGCKKFFNEEASDEINPLTDIRPCKVPFKNIEIQAEGDVYSCCPDFLKERKPLGNLSKQTLEEIWTGNKLEKLRNNVTKGDYSLCKRDICGMYSPCSKEEIPEDYKTNISELAISYDYECNCNCITCRDDIRISDISEMNLFENVFLPKILKFAENVNCVSLSGSGEPFYSRHARHLMQELVNKYPNIRLKIMTNGVFLDKQNIEELGIEYNISTLSVSVHSVNRETYKQIFRADNFDTVMKNIKLMAKWKKKKKIDWMVINFVVHSLNYKEMVDFAKLAQKLDIMAFFSAYRPWLGTKMAERYDEVAVFEPTNEHYEEFVQILQNPVFKDREHVYVENRFHNLVFQ